MEQAATTILRGVDELLKDGHIFVALRITKDIGYHLCGDTPQLRNDFKRIDSMVQEKNFDKVRELLNAVIGRLRNYADAPRGSEV